MDKTNKSQVIFDRGWIVKIRDNHIKSEGNPRIILLLHGWTGDETSMDVFYQALPPTAILISPRGPISSNEGGFGWVAIRPGQSASFKDYKTVLTPLIPALKSWIREHNASESKIEVIGFSQGAATALVLVLAFPELFSKAVCIAGFLPSDAINYVDAHRISGLPVLIAHGTEDTIVPIQRAKQAAETLISLGANVEYCEDNVGHKISSHCVKKVQRFLNDPSIQ